MPAARSTSVGLVAFLFAVSGRDELPGVVLTRLLGEFGIGPAAARQLLARMRADGQITGERAGRGVAYRLTGTFLAQAQLLRTPPGPPPWDGRFHALLYQVPETGRAFRDRLRRHATFVGYGNVQPGVLIATRDRSGELAHVLADPPEGTVLRHARLSLDDPVEAASVAWELPVVAAAFDGHLAALRGALAEAGELTADVTTLRRFVALTNATVVELLRDPVLPPQLYPPGWPGDELRAAVGRLFARYTPPARAYVLGLHDTLAHA